MTTTAKLPVFVNTVRFTDYDESCDMFSAIFERGDSDEFPARFDGGALAQFIAMGAVPPEVERDLFGWDRPEGEKEFDPHYLVGKFYRQETF